MELRFTPEQEAHILEIAQHQGKTPEQFVLEATVNFSESDWQVRQILQQRIARADQGVFIEEDEMNARIEKMLHS